MTGMRTLLFLLVGCLLLAASALLGKLFSSNYPGATFAATLIFVALWLGIAGTNLWVGVAKAGYSLSEELPIFEFGGGRLSVGGNYKYCVHHGAGASRELSVEADITCP
jgi:hypothetical protein